MTLADRYRNYISCLNRQDWALLGEHLHEDVVYNGVRIGLAGYRKMLERDFRAIPDLRFNIELLVDEPPRIAARLNFDCSPVGMLFNLAVNGKKVQFSENVIYEFRDEVIAEVWSIIDRAAIASQL